VSSLVDSLPFYRKLTRRLATLGFLILLLVFTGKWLDSIWADLRSGDIWSSDFFSIWSFAKFAIANPAVQIYDDLPLREFQMDLGATPRYTLPYAHPPFFLFYIIPFGFLPFYFAYGLWFVCTFAAYFIASCCQQQRCRLAILLTIFAPATIVTLAFGQTGFLSSALILGGFRLAANRPIISGALFGLASFKPQLGILIPIALISARLWRTVAAAVVTVLVLVLASGAAFGWSIWALWFAKLFAHADWVADMKTRLQPTIIASLITLGIDVSTARIVQAFVSVIVAILIWVCFRRGVTMLTTAALLVGTFLATPYAFLYDMPIVTNAILAVLRHKDQTNRDLTIAEILVLGLALIVPAIMLETWRLSVIRCLPLILLFGLIVWRIVRGRLDFAESGATPPKEMACVRGQQIG
jgi:Glycosyltransferase family 87